MLTATEGNQILKELILSGRPFCAGKIGNSEHWALVNHLSGIPQWSREVIYFTTVLAGVFPADMETLHNFAEVFYSCLDKVDLSAKWLKLDEEILRSKNAAIILTELRGLEPYYHQDPWSRALAGKKVMVLSPFADTIQKQYIKRESIWNKMSILPEFDLEPVRTPLSHYLEKSLYKDWFEGLDDLQKRITASDSEIVITGCGAWSLPLAAYAKTVGKQAIHLGGPTQILFGIKGRRWDLHEVIATYCNSNWVRPSAKETPDREKTKLVENGCYW